MRSALVVLASLLALSACGPGDGGALDGGSDGGGLDASPTPDDAARSCGTPPEEGCACDTQGETFCFAGMATQCCLGAWQTFWDGPCGAIPDAGAPDCAATPTWPGCPCATEDATACRFARWTVVCTSGSWQERIGHLCCGAERE